MKIISIVGARPQFIKVKPIIDELKKYKAIKHILVHTGQHYDYNMSEVFFKELAIPKPDYHLGVGSGSHGFQTAGMLKRIEVVLLKEKPDWVIVYGDTNSTLAGALAAAKLKILIVHVESGLRSYNMNMPEEINRVLTDRLSSILFCPTLTAVNNLKKEGFSNILNQGKLIDNTGLKIINRKSLPIVINVGDIMYDALLFFLKGIKKRECILSKLKILPQNYYLTTIHRAENTDDLKRINSVVKALIQISKIKTVIWPVHPRTLKIIDSYDFPPSLRIISPVGYLDMLALEKNALKIITDSGGIQKEAYWLGVPCVTLREETEWKETTKNKYNMVVGNDSDKIIEAVTCSKRPLFFKFSNFWGDGTTAAKIIQVLNRF